MSIKPGLLTERDAWLAACAETIKARTQSAQPCTRPARQKGSKFRTVHNSSNRYSSRENGLSTLGRFPLLVHTRPINYHFPMCHVLVPKFFVAQPCCRPIPVFNISAWDNAISRGLSMSRRDGYTLVSLFVSLSARFAGMIRFALIAGHAPRPVGAIPFQAAS